MSRYSGNHDTCPVCKLKYKNLRTGLCYDEVYQMLWRSAEDPNEWRYKRRNTILGFWHSIKQEYWEQHKKLCEEEMNVTL